MEKLTAVQRFPEGLLPLLQLQTSGVPPQRLIPDVALGVDGLPFYSSASDEIQTGTAVALTGAGTFGTSLTVPQGEFWLVHHCSCRWSAPAGASAMRPAWALNRNGRLVYLPGESNGTLTLAGIGSAVVWTWLPARLMLLRPGDFFQVEESATPDNTTGQVAALVTRLRT